MTSLLLLVLAATSASPKGGVASAHPLASQAGAEVLRAGGNAVDAAVAAAFVLSVVEPESSGLGGGGFALVYRKKEDRTVALDFREVAPAAATSDMFAGDRAKGPIDSALDGGLSVAVPGAVKGYAELSRRFGKLPLSRLVEEAARIAERGFPVGLHLAEAAQRRIGCLSAQSAAAKAFLVPGPDGRPTAPRPGDVLREETLARTLRRIGRDPEVFYRGELSREVVRAARAQGGILTEKDLLGYRVRERTPLEGSYRGHRIVSMPLPSAGGAIVIGLLQGLERAEKGPVPYRSVPFLHAMMEISKELYARRSLLGDPAYIPWAEGEVREMISTEGAEKLASGVTERAREIDAPPPPRESSQTSHISVVDGEGNAVSLTTTVNYRFGSCVVVPEAGFVLNDEMDDFDAAAGVPNVFGQVGSGANLPAAGKIPLSSMAPVLVFDKEGKLWLALGSPGGTNIPTTVAQVVSHLVDDGMSLSQAVSTPRIHHQWRPNAIQVEPGGLEEETARALIARGHELLYRPRPFGNPQAVEVMPGGWIEAASDASGGGEPAAP